MLLKISGSCSAPVHILSKPIEWCIVGRHVEYAVPQLVPYYKHYTRRAKYGNAAYSREHPPGSPQHALRLPLAPSPPAWLAQPSRPRSQHPGQGLPK